LNGKCLVDSNVLVYSVDLASARKSRLARQLLATLAPSQRAVTTPQAIAEFFVNTTRPKGRPAALLTRPAASRWIASWLAAVDWLDLTRTTTEEAVRAAVQYGMKMYDAQMWAVARVHGIPLIVTEDMQFAPVIEGVGYVDPFAESFQMSDIDL
jgi:predicted nucleic acid-binding protein